MNHYRTAIRSLVFALTTILFCAFPLQAGDLYSRICPVTEAVVHLKVREIRSHLTTPAGKELLGFFGITDSLLPGGKELDPGITDAVFSILSLRKNRCMIFCRTSLPEQKFYSLLKKNIKEIQITSRMYGPVRVCRITGKNLEGKTFFTAYLAKDILLFSETDPAWYFNQSTPKGLTADQRKSLKKDLAVSGFLSPGKKFYRKNPFFPRFAQIGFYASIGKDSSLTVCMEAPLLPGEDPAAKLQQAQQTRLMLALLLNNIDQSLAEEFINSGSIYEHKNTLFLRQYLSAALLKKIFLQGIPVLMQQSSSGTIQGAPKRKVSHP